VGPPSEESPGVETGSPFREAATPSSFDPRNCCPSSRARNLRPVISQETQEDLHALAELIEAGTVTPVVEKTYPLMDAPEAIREVERGHARGKVVVTV
jgi:NADPH:quinone reductase-like Zn-dependent oxidoreductase